MYIAVIMQCPFDEGAQIVRRRLRLDCNRLASREFGDKVENFGLNGPNVSLQFTGVLRYK